MGLLSSMYFIECNIVKDGVKGVLKTNIEKGLLISWEQVIKHIQKKEGLSSLIITKTKKL